MFTQGLSHRTSHPPFQEIKLSVLGCSSETRRFGHLHRCTSSSSHLPASAPANNSQPNPTKSQSQPNLHLRSSPRHRATRGATSPTRASTSTSAPRAPIHTRWRIEFRRLGPCTSRRATRARLKTRWWWIREELCWRSRAGLFMRLCVRGGEEEGYLRAV